MLDRIIVVQGENFCTPVVTLQKDNRTITLIGASHYGFPSYYEKMQALLDSLWEKGWMITHEGADWSNLAQGEFAGFPSRLVYAMHKMRKKTALILAAFGLSEQGDRITPRSGWIFTDSLLTKVVEKVTKKIDFEHLDQLTNSDLFNITKRMLSQFMTRCEMEVVTTLSETTPLRDERDTEAASAILNFATHSHVVSCWGASHLPGIVSHLGNAGFDIAEIVWWPFFPTQLPITNTVAPS